MGLQRHRHAAGVPAEAAEAGARGARLPGAGGALDPLLVRDGGAVARHRARARLRHRDDADRPFVEVSGRKGLGVKADDLLDRLTDKAAGGSVAKRNPELPADDVRRTAETIAIAAVRYFMVKFSRGKVIVFDIDEALSFEGESGPYLQYAVVRANNIFAKLKERDGLDEAAVAVGAGVSVRRPSLDGDDDEAHELWGLVLEAARLDEVVDQAVRTLELSVVAKYAFGLAQAFNGFYHEYSILNEERADVRLWRAAAVAYYRAQLTTRAGSDGMRRARIRCRRDRAPRSMTRTACQSSASPAAAASTTTSRRWSGGRAAACSR